MDQMRSTKMSHSNLPQSDADRIAAGFTAVAIAVIVWVIVAVFPNPGDLPVMTAQASIARHVDEGNHAAADARSGRSLTRSSATARTAVHSGAR
jgi:hypothetical protein